MEGKDVLACQTLVGEGRCIEFCGDLVRARARAAKDGLAFRVNSTGSKACRTRTLRLDGNLCCSIATHRGVGDAIVLNHGLFGRAVFKTAVRSPPYGWQF